MAHKKAGGTASNLKDSNAQRLGVKCFGGQNVKSGNILVRQRGTKFHSGKGTMLGKDDTIFASTTGKVKFFQKVINRYTGKRSKANFVSVE
jgi:large subunit ribosomal protein L27